jgi:hypothetical protein
MLNPKTGDHQPAFLFLTIAPEDKTQPRSRIDYAHAPESGAQEHERGLKKGQTPSATIKQREEVQHCWCLHLVLVKSFYESLQLDLQPERHYLRRNRDDPILSKTARTEAMVAYTVA